ncbi:flavo protein [Hyaloscypha variabilis F]|uniref:Flavo protein n=1 Tax=Hyaloscypha variabilis (strain UAMH 11265 / GT02V1 / F) TaxID=1149755 RepID=A0A2J6RKU4_HYAVF|nr:flavo protein [Hyaloscypha variabilis F]
MAAITKKIAIITGSTRAVRIGPQVAKFVNEVLEANIASPKGKDATFTLSQVDIATFKLPVFDEAVVPATVPMFAQFEHEHSKAWSAEISKYDGYVIVTAEYNIGIPAAVKNAVDYLYNEIKGKPFLIISYGILGGGSANDALNLSLTKGIHAHVVETRPKLAFAKNEPFEYGLPLDMRLASTGQLGEQTLKEWNDDKSDIVKGFEELKEYLVNTLEPTPV